MEKFLSNCLPFWAQLAEDDKQLVMQNIKQKKISENNIENNVDVKCEGLNIVKTGMIRAFINSDKGQEITLFRITNNEICVFSIICMIKQLDVNINIEAEKDSTVYVIPISIYKEINERNDYVNKFTYDIISSRLVDVVSIFSNYAFMTVEQRLVSALLRYSSLNLNNCVIITHEKLAKDIGSVREVVSRILKQLQLRKIVQLSRGKIEIIDKIRLKKFFD
ncbi:Crp/Fnr family transcriptional regulator [Sedimentibacter sp. zth1]|uniref:Crp/Fnr family transcriptional regulator n=1 Tax=Sedimentibacter sp. zth1 TaxID=2816908 RepID=UPI001A935203|nr:Crp/Fnr family transcriptional regulator [Sedimentibacter sp. zth1]QSX07018.1 Crp/Fnr family transcriptional regulator [Sedimentibacter sp. zth1]